ncbi:transglutaminase domain-containing protein [Mycoplasmopsis hyopharyngis]|uniref:transglutaminase domain-containing protein n=1 Tax=Mycoplasmopsis hyopharyngis TaxID=29558 RepID=UPI0038739BA0
MKTKRKILLNLAVSSSILAIPVLAVSCNLRKFFTWVKGSIQDNELEKEKQEKEKKEKEEKEKKEQENTDQNPNHSNKDKTDVISDNNIPFYIQKQVPTEQENQEFLEKRNQYKTLIERLAGKEEISFVALQEVNKLSDVVSTNFAYVSPNQNNKRKLQELAAITNSIYQSLFKVNDFVFNNYYFSESRYRKELISYINFLTKYLAFYNPEKPSSGPMAHKKPIIKEVIKLYNDKKYEHILVNFDSYISISNKIHNYLKNMENNFDLFFNVEDALYLNKDKLAWQENVKETNLLSAGYIRAIRKSLLLRGTAEVKNIAHTPPFAFNGENEPNDIINVLDLIYDLTGGSNYYNDVAFFKYTKNLNNVSYSFNFAYRTDSPQEELEVDKLVLSTIPKIISKNFDQKQQVRAVHNWIVQNVDFYEPDETEEMKFKIRSPYAFVHRKFGVVCEGYARMFQKFMTFLNIPSWYLTGDAVNPANQVEGHAWNMVKINNEYLFVDCTWDDPIVDKTIKENDIEHKSITPYRNQFLLVPWKTFANSRNINPTYLKLHLQRKQLNKDYLDFYQIVNSQ